MIPGNQTQMERAPQGPTQTTGHLRVAGQTLTLPLKQNETDEYDAPKLLPTPASITTTPSKPNIFRAKDSITAASYPLVAQMNATATTKMVALQLAQMVLASHDLFPVPDDQEDTTSDTVESGL